MLGIDITKIARFENAKEGFIKAILHPHEMKELNHSNNKALFLAARWAIKEALFKVDNNLNHFNQIRLEKHNKKYQYPGYTISTSREGNCYIAVVMKL